MSCAGGSWCRSPQRPAQEAHHLGRGGLKQHFPGRAAAAKLTVLIDGRSKYLTPRPDDSVEITWRLGS